MNRRWPDYRTRLIGRCGRSWARGRSPTLGPYCTSRRAQCQGFRLNISTRISFRAVGPSLLIIAEDSLPEARGAVVTSFPLDYLLSPLGPVGADEPYSPPALYGKWALQLDHLTWALTISDTLAPPARRPPTPKMVPGRCPPRFLVPTLFDVPNNLLTSFRTVPIKCLIPLLFARSAINVVCYGSAMGINWCVCYQLYVFKFGDT